jgi:hypothetical protein
MIDMTTPQPGMGPELPPMPSPEAIEEAKAIMEAVAWEDIESILRTDERRNYNIDIETDSTVFDDAEAEKQQRIEVMGAMTNWLERALPAIQANRTIAPLMKELTMFTLGAFKIGRTLEETFEDAFQQIQKMPEQPNPEAEKLKAEMEMEKLRFQMDMQLKQLDLQTKQATAQLNTQGKQADMQVKQQSSIMDMQAKQTELQIKEVSAKLDMILKQQEIALEREKMALEREKMQMAMAGEREKLQLSAETSALKRDDMRFASEMKREAAEEKREAQSGEDD